MEVSVHPCKFIVSSFDNTVSLLVYVQIWAAFTDDPWRISNKSIVSPGNGTLFGDSIAVASDSAHLH